ncbi:MAG: hypothetical protein V8T86_13375 [Victivallis sp.]
MRFTSAPWSSATESAASSIVSRTGPQTLVYWSVTGIETESNRPDPRFFKDLYRRGFTLDVKDGVYTGCNAFGTPFEVKAADGKLKLEAARLPTFLSGLSGLTPAVPFRAVAKRGASADGFDRTIVFPYRAFG